MAVTSPDNIWTPDAGDDYALTTDLAATADTIQDALTNQATRFPGVVANQAARTALFPTPVQGNRVFRSDLGYEEAYLGLYNATTNPGGASAAGWYPATNRAFVATRTGTQTLASGWNILSGTGMTQSRNDGLGVYSAGATGAFTITAPGWYRLDAKYFLTTPSNPPGIQITKNSTAPSTAGTLVESSVTAPSPGLTISDTAQLAAGDVIRVLVYTLAANSISTTGTRGAGLSIVKL